MTIASLQTYWEPAFTTYYEASYQELASEALIGRWQTIDKVVGILVGATASSSAIAGWPLWGTSWGKFLWIVLAGFAALAALVHRELGVPAIVKEQEELRSLFSEIRFDLETFLLDLEHIGLPPADADKRYQDLRTKLAEATRRTRPGLTYTQGLRQRVRAQLDRELTAKGYLP